MTYHVSMANSVIMSLPMSVTFYTDPNFLCLYVFLVGIYIWQCLKSRQATGMHFKPESLSLHGRHTPPGTAEGAGDDYTDEKTYPDVAMDEVIPAVKALIRAVR